MELKSLKLTDKEFMANGHKYIISDKISIRRYAEYQKLQPKLTYGLGFDEIFKALKSAYTALNTKEGKVADAAVILHNIMNGVSKVEESSRVHPALKMAALFINREGEDLKVYDEELMNKKIEDWTEEGFNISDFFTLSLNSISGFREAYKESIQKSEMLPDLSS